MTPEIHPMDPALEQAMSDIRDEAIDDAVIEAAAGRVWARIVEAQDEEVAAGDEAPHIRNCADFQGLIPDYRAGRLPEAKAMLLKDHLHQCVACRRYSEGKVVEFPQLGARRAAPAKPRYVLWAAAAVVVAATGVTVWLVESPFHSAPGRAVVQAVNGALFEITGDGIRPLAVGQDFPAGVEIRTAKDSQATLALWDGSTVDVRERSALSASQSGKDIDVRVARGSILVQAAKRRTGHLYVATDDCRVAVTGTVFSVNAGTKGTRVSVIQGEVRMSQNNTERALHPGDQAVTGANLETAPIQYDTSWSRTGERLTPAGSGKPRLSPLLDHAPASTALFAILPRTGSLGAMSALRQTATQNPQLGAWLEKNAAAMQPVFARLQAATASLDEVALAIVAGADDKKPKEAIFLATEKGPGLADALKGLGATVEERGGLAVFGANREAVEGAARDLEGPATGFKNSPCYDRLREALGAGDSAALCVDLDRFGQPANGVRYFIAEERPLNGQPAPRATIGFDAARSGLANWLAAPAPMGSLDYISGNATLVTAFVVKNPAAIIDQTLALAQRSPEAAEKTLAEASRETGVDVRADLAASLGGEFALALDGPVFPTPSLKLIVEVYDPQRFQATLAKVVEQYNREAQKSGGKPLRSSQQTVEGRTYYVIGASDPNPLTEATYTFTDGYLIAALGDSRGLIAQALATKTARTSITHATQFLAMMPRDHYANFSAVIYQNLGSTLAPLAGLLSAFVPPQMAGRGSPAPNLGSMKPTFVAAYGEPDRITIAGNGGMLGMSAGNIANASLLSIAGNSLPMAALQGTPARQGAFR